MPRPERSRGREGWEALLSDPRHAVIALDFDGTLSPIVDRPEDAHPLPGAVEVVADLARRVGRVAVITGRPARFVVDALIGIPGLVVLGQYGVQRWEDGHLRADPPVPGLATAREELPVLLLTEAGVEIEDKGHSLVVHSRSARDPLEALARLHLAVSALAEETGLQLHSGRLVLELRPPGHDKGRALRSLVEGVSGVLYVGDDVGDLPAFDEVDRLRDRGVGGVLVCSDSDEGPEELRARADLVVPGPAGVVAVLADLAAELA